MADLISDYAPEALRAEWRFLIGCMATQCRSGRAAAPGVLDATGLDWNSIIRLAERHCVVPLLATAVAGGAITGVPPEAQGDLSNRYRYFAHKGMTFAVELRDLLARLKKAGIRCIPLKGPVLTAGSYGRLGMRDYSDLDLLVATQDVPAAAETLATIGYTGWNVPQQWIASHLHTESEHNLVCSQRGFVVDLHWAVGRKYFTMPMDFDDLWHRSARTRLIGSPVPDLSAEDAVLYLCYHGGRHLFGRLSWVCDVAATVATYRHLDWDLILTRSTQMGARRLFLLGLCLAQGLMQTDLPPAMRRAIRDDIALHALVANLLRNLFRPNDAPSALKQQLETSLFHLRVRERPLDRLRCLFWAAAPNMRDWGDTRLPRALSFLTVLTRPIRLLRNNLAPAAR